MGLSPSNAPEIQLPVHIPALDGLRGLAILAVMFFHFNLIFEEKHTFDSAAATLIRSCWCGVDLFFVLSGFLITGILLDYKEKPGYFRNFYARRVLRIFPLYYGLLAVVFIIGPRFEHLATDEFNKLAENQLPLWLYYSNLVVAWYGDFNFNAEWIEFNHFWSLAIEEQFYLLWPTVVWFCSRRTLAFVCAGLIVVAVLVRSAFMFGDDNMWRIYEFTPCRWDGLALGGLAALTYRTPGLWTRLTKPAWISAVACFIILAWYAGPRGGLNVEQQFLQFLGYSLLALFFAALLVAAVNARPDGAASRVWNSPALRFYGKYSYGLYILHPTLMEYVWRVYPAEEIAAWPGGWTASALLYMLLSLAVSTAAAWLIWHVYEKHFLKLKSFFKPPDKQAG
jgi:peptidoglycan/LPS O-acetylase OafA/YrhL